MSRPLLSIEDAQLHNARRLTTEKLRRELSLALGRAEQPEVRVEWIRVLRDELANRTGVAATREP